MSVELKGKVKKEKQRQKISNIIFTINICLLKKVRKYIKRKKKNKPSNNTAVKNTTTGNNKIPFQNDYLDKN